MPKPEISHQPVSFLLIAGMAFCASALAVLGQDYVIRDVHGRAAPGLLIGRELPTTS